jgi:hypothetical protein
VGTLSGSVGQTTKRITLGAAVVLVLGLTADLAGITTFATGLDLHGIVTKVGGSSAPDGETPTVHAPTGHATPHPGSVSPDVSATPHAEPPSIEYLANVKPASESMFVEGRVANIGGKDYQDTVLFPCDADPATTSGVYSLGGTASRFKATVGLEPKWSSDYKVPITVLGDKMTLGRYIVSVGDARKIDVNVKGVGLLRLVCGDAVDEDGVTFPVEVAWGNAEITRG